jgi:hypothetical protein
MSSNSDPIKTRRDFIKAGLSGATAVAALGAATAVAETKKEQPQSTTKWVGAGYLMARPVNNDSEI